MPDVPTITTTPWQVLRQLTPARIALGRAGISQTTATHLDFQAAHAAARDAVHLALDSAALCAALTAAGHHSILLHSAASDRRQYLQRPDLGRRLSADSAQQLRDYHARHASAYDVVIVISDGLSALAVQRHAEPLLRALTIAISTQGWSLAPIIVVQQGRVAVADEIAQILHARMSVHLIGERPGLSSPDSLGVYFTYQPRIGCNDAQRNCISNIHAAGLSYNVAAQRLRYLMCEASRLGLSGVLLKEAAEPSATTLSMSTTQTPFLLMPD